jgi:hypothetical protein
MFYVASFKLTATMILRTFTSPGEQILPAITEARRGFGVINHPANKVNLYLSCSLFKRKHQPEYCVTCVFTWTALTDKC